MTTYARTYLVALLPVHSWLNKRCSSTSDFLNANWLDDQRTSKTFGVKDLTSFLEVDLCNEKGLPPVQIYVHRCCMCQGAVSYLLTGLRIIATAQPLPHC